MQRFSLIGGECDGRTIDVKSLSHDVLVIPFMCGGDFCKATYKTESILADGVVVMQHVESYHRTDERATLFMGNGWEHGLCREFVESEEGKAFIANRKAAELAHG